MSQREEVTVPEPRIFSHSLKVEDTTKGVRFTVHVYANSIDDTINEAFGVYDAAIKRAAAMQIPMEGGDGAK